MGHSAPVVVLVSVDPRESHRANEAIRIGLGIVAGDNDVVLVLLGGATHVLDADTDELVDGDDIVRVRTGLRQLGIPFHVDAAVTPEDDDWNADGHPLVPVTPAQLTDIVRRGRRVLVF